MTVAGYPGGDECLSNGDGGDILDGRGLRPPGKRVNHRQDVGVTLVRWEGTNHVEVYMFEAAVWYEEHLWGRFSVPVKFIVLALDVDADPLADVSIYARPHHMTLLWTRSRVARIPR